MELKLVSVACSSMACSTSCGIVASVNTKLSIVAMSGAIMPDPFAMPLILTACPSICAVAVAILGNVSVVMMARAACSQAVAPVFS